MTVRFDNKHLLTPPLHTLPFRAWWATLEDRKLVKGDWYVTTTNIISLNTDHLVFKIKVENKSSRNLLNLLTSIQDMLKLSE